MIIQYVGKQGTGKTTYLVKKALQEDKRIRKGKSKYSRVLTNVPIHTGNDQTNVYLFQNEDFGVYDMSNSLILFDEAMLQFDTRDYKGLTREQRNFLMLVRHYKSSILFFSQTYDGLDKKIRQTSNRLYLLEKRFGTTLVRRVDTELYVPKRNLKNSVQLDDGEPKLKYYRVGFLRNLVEQLLGERDFKRSSYYRYFDSYEAPEMPRKEFEKCV